MEKPSPQQTIREDLVEIQRLTDRFFDVFTNTHQQPPKVKDLFDIFIPQGIIINNTSGIPEVYDLNNFIMPREKMLTDGTLINFSERERLHKTNIHGNIAQRFCEYEKSGELKGQYFEAKGQKSLQFIKVEGKWKMSSVIWCDE